LSLLSCQKGGIVETWEQHTGRGEMRQMDRRHRLVHGHCDDDDVGDGPV